MLERDMREPVEKWFRDQGYDTAFERLFPSGYCDVLAYRFAPRTSRRIPWLLEVVAVELKLKDVPTAICQARGYAWGGARSFVAMPSERIQKMRASTVERFAKNDVGLISVGDQIEILQDAHYWPDGDGLEWMRKKLWRVKKTQQEYAGGTF
jgi:hypothetical protein